ncbi:Uma2 family endonuclease [Actinomycetospora termitidis]|uniref:Uma2 family endonuclease n=1 Tax=Actinomycetospora termitidis TaxID=3053470 RepID=A0ABT7MDE2_9PSEU|nr:Uma2 family endonuclease [Actinomycetospora sp. Odt1-22]MDL5158693.1 Uma2 family endonuclease [Actinomycetospora sp. Odt1-22]
MSSDRGGDMSISYSAPSRLLELADWDALPEDELHHVELVEGVLVVSPRAQFQHGHAVVRVASALHHQLPPHLATLIEVEIVVEGDPFPTVRVPDVVVVPADIVDRRARCDADEVRVAVEVLSPGSRRTDRIMKAAEYGSAGIAHYVLVDPEGATLVLALRDGAYEEVDVLELDGVRIDLG